MNANLLYMHVQGEAAQQRERRSGNGNDEEVQAEKSRHEWIGVKEVCYSKWRLKNRKHPKSV